MNTLARRIVYLLVITLAINFGGWTFNTEAVADMVLNDRQCMASGSDPSFTQSDSGKADSAQTPCNYWCHAVGNFMGLPRHWVPAFPEATNGQIPYTFLVIAPSSPDGRFRPPRRSS
ncbi:MAG: hypothetical protein AB1418_04590 [Pseudomonadota bacterium]